MFIDFDEGHLMNVKALLPGAITGKLVRTLSGDYASEAAEKGIDYILIRFNSASETVISRLRAAGVKSGVWTPNNEKNISGAIDSGADIIITDYPNTAMRLINKHDSEETSIEQ